MTGYICKVPVMFGGKKYFPGDTIPGEVVIPKRATALVKSGHIAAINGETTQSSKTDVSEAFDTNPINIPIRTEKGFYSLTTTLQAVETVFNILQMNVEDASKIIDTVTDDDLLLILHAVEKRKGVIKVIEERHKVLDA